MAGAPRARWSAGAAAPGSVVRACAPLPPAVPSARALGASRRPGSAGAAGRAGGAPARRSRRLLGAAHLPRRRAAASRLVLLATGDGRGDVLLDLGGGAVREPRR